MIVTGSPVQAVVDAIKARLSADTTLTGLCTGGVYGALPRGTRTTFPYLSIGRTTMGDEAFAMTLEGGKVSVQIDGWSATNGPYQMRTIQGRTRALLQRAPLAVRGFTPIAGSLKCEMEDCFDERDEDMPDRTLYHGVQRWAIEVEESA